MECANDAEYSVEMSSAAGVSGWQRRLCEVGLPVEIQWIFLVGWLCEGVSTGDVLVTETHDV